jgi:alanyl-tRNA synthetase
VEVRSATEQTCQLLNCAIPQLADAVAQLLQRVKSLRKQAASGSGETSAAPAAKWPPTTGAKPTYSEIREALKQAARALNAGPMDVPARVEALLNESQQLARRIAEAKSGPTIDSGELLKSAVKIGNAQVVVLELPNTNANALRDLIDQIRRQSSRTAVFLASIAGADKINLVAGLSRDLVDSGLSAGDWVKQVAPVVGGGGGGKPDFAQAGGKQPEKIKQALQAAADYMHAALRT